MKGQIILEVLVALSIAVVVMTVITMTVLSSLNTSVATKNQNLASQYAQEGMEIMRTLSNVPINTNWCLGKGQRTLQANCTTPNIDGTYLRRVSVQSNATACGATLKQVRVTVSWSDAKCANTTTYCNSVPLVSCLAL